MSNADISKITEWAEILIAKVPEHLHDDIIIFGSAAIALNQYQILDSPKDLDVFVSPSAFHSLQEIGFPKFDKGAVFGISILPGFVEAFEDFNGIPFNQVKRNSKHYSFSKPLRYADIADIKEWKTLRGSEKDVKHLYQIQTFETGLA